MLKHLAFRWLVAVVMLAVCAYGQEERQRERPRGATFYVAVHGNDSWSGKLATANVEKSDGPFATLERARDEIRGMKTTGGASDGVTVFVREGTYYLPETFQLESKDSGSPGAPIVYRAFEGERPVLSGGRRITGFVPHKGRILKADLKAQGFPEFYFRQLFLNSKRQELARYPNYDPNRPVSGGWAYVAGERTSMYKGGRDKVARQAPVKAKDWRQWERRTDAEMLIFPRFNWNCYSVPIASANPVTHSLDLARDVRYGIRAGDRYFIRNVLEELDADGEWFLDRTTRTLYFQPPADAKGMTVTAPVLDTLIRLERDAAHITIRGFTLENCDRNAVFMRGTSNCLVAGNTIRNVGGYCSARAAVTVWEGFNNGVTGNDIYDTGADGVFILGGSRTALTPSGNYADNNYIHHIGAFKRSAKGIHVSGVGNRVSHNLIHDSPRHGIVASGNDHVIEYNHIRHVNTETEDTAGFYLCSATYGWMARGTVIRYNYFHDILGFGWNRQARRWESPHRAHGIYIDDSVSGTHIHGNITLRTAGAGVYVHGGSDNLIENNILVEGGWGQMLFSAWQPRESLWPRINKGYAKYKDNPAYRKYPNFVGQDLKETYRMVRNTFRRNIACYAKGELYHLRKLPFDKTVFDANLIYHFGRPPKMHVKDVPMSGHASAWAAWKALGLDQNSIIADPRFVNPEQDDYRLRPDSPAFKLGFKPIPVDKIGPYKSLLRASWPIVEAEGVREHPVKCTAPEPVVLKPRSIFHVPRLKEPWRLDGYMDEKDTKTALHIGNPVPGKFTPHSYAWLRYDDEFLYVAFRNMIDPATPLKTEAAWGPNDAVEVALRDAAGGPKAPTFVLRGYVKGQFESSTEAGAPASAARNLKAATTYFSQTAIKDRWTVEWRIPFAALGIKPATGQRVLFNLTVRNTASHRWFMWCNTGGNSWLVANAGVILIGE